MKNFLPKNYMQYWWQKNIFLNMKFDWRNIYSLPRITTINKYLSSFQYKICNNILILNKKLFVFWMKNTPLCSFCTKKDESLLHIFSKCTSVICLEQLFLKKKIDFMNIYTTDCFGFVWALEWQYKSWWAY